MTGKKKGSETIFTIPGEKLGVVEEYVPGQGTYESDGAIFSQVVGYATLDSYNKNISIRQLSKRPTVPREGSTVIGVVTQYQERMASVDLFMIDGKVLHPPYGAILHISNSSRRFERVMNDVCRTGDIVKAKVISVKNKVPMLSTQSPELGVIKAFCSQCGGLLKLRSNSLHCVNCNHQERRKIASTYDQDVRGG